MATKIFVNLAVKDLNRSIAYFEKLGFTNNKQFTDETAACMVVSDDIFVMLLTHAKFQGFTTKEIADATKVTEVMTCLSADSKAEVDRLCDAALAAGGSKHMPPMDLGFMYLRTFNDLDGHVWEVVWMDPAKIEGN
jgi:uncharacterized protein